MPDPSPLLPGRMVLIKAKLVSIAEDRIWVEATTGYTMAVVEADIVEALDEAAPPVRDLAPGDLARDIQGVEWAVMTHPMEVDGQKPQVCLWNDQRGGAWDYVDNLIVVSRNPTPASAENTV